jgi:hypothetical protein
VRAVLTLVGIAVLLLIGWMAYANVFSDDTAVRALAEKRAREKAGCGSACQLTGIQGSRGPFTEHLTHYFKEVGTIVVKCRRQYIAFGEYSCTAERP